MGYKTIGETIWRIGRDKKGRSLIVGTPNKRLESDARKARVINWSVSLIYVAVIWFTQAVGHETV